MNWMNTNELREIATLIDYLNDNTAHGVVALGPIPIFDMDGQPLGRIDWTADDRYGFVLGEDE